jgi:hypothetical protein
MLKVQLCRAKADGGQQLLDERVGKLKLCKAFCLCLLPSTLCHRSKFSTSLFTLLKS